MKKIGSLLILLLFVPTMILSGCGDPQEVVQAQKILDYNLVEKYADSEASGELIDGVRVIEVQAFQFFFEPKEIVVNKGEKVKLIVKAMDVPHGIEIHGLDLGGFDINSKIRPGIPAEIEFTADEAGIFEIICSIYCGFSHSDMRGLFIVR